MSASTFCAALGAQATAPARKKTKE